MRNRKLSQDVLYRILAGITGRTILIGGQALAWWADYFGLTPGAEFPQGVTFDIDFLGTKEIT